MRESRRDRFRGKRVDLPRPPLHVERMSPTRHGTDRQGSTRLSDNPLMCYGYLCPWRVWVDPPVIGLHQDAALRNTDIDA